MNMKTMHLNFMISGDILLCKLRVSVIRRRFLLFDQNLNAYKKCESIEY